MTADELLRQWLLYRLTPHSGYPPTSSEYRALQAATGAVAPPPGPRVPRVDRRVAGPRVHSLLLDLDVERPLWARALRGEVCATYGITGASLGARAKEAGLEVDTYARELGAARRWLEEAYALVASRRAPTRTATVGRLGRATLVPRDS